MPACLFLQNLTICLNVLYSPKPSDFLYLETRSLRLNKHFLQAQTPIKIRPKGLFSHNIKKPFASLAQENGGNFTLLHFNFCPEICARQNAHMSLVNLRSSRSANVIIRVEMVGGSWQKGWWDGGDVVACWWLIENLGKIEIKVLNEKKMLFAFALQGEHFYSNRL